MARVRIGWRAWDAKAFQEARASERPVFLFLSAFWCEWGGAPPAIYFGDGPTAALLRDAFVPVVADAEKNPEVASRYGAEDLPCCAVLRPDGTLMARFQPAALHESRGSLAALARAGAKVPPVTATLGLFPVPYLPAADASLERGLEAVERIRRRVEEALAGELAGASDKAGLRAVSPLRFLIHYAHDTGERHVLERAVAALHALGHSQLYDAVEGGFFAGDRPDGSQTYKLLRANADWLILALRLSREPEGAFALPLARGILHYLQHRLSLPTGAFAAGQRADAGYYRLTLEERRQVPPPALEATAFAAPNLLAIRAFCKAWRLLGERAYLDRALQAFSFTRTGLAAPDGSLAHFHAAGPAGLGYLDDLVEQGHAQMALYHSTLEPGFLEGVRAVARRMVTEYLNPAGGGFLDMRLEDRPSRLPTAPVLDFRLNARAALFLVLAAAQLDEDSLGVVARSVLSLLLAEGEPDLEGACLLGTGLLAALYPMSIYEVITDGSAQQRLRVIESLRGTGAGLAVVTHRLAARGEGMRQLPRIVAHCGHQSREVPVGEEEPAGQGRGT